MFIFYFPNINMKLADKNRRVYNNQKSSITKNSNPKKIKANVNLLIPS